MASVNEQLDKDFDKWVKNIRMAIEDKHEVKIIKEKIEVKKEFWKTYKIISIDLEKMKARAICEENGNSGNLNITSYDLEQLYNHLPIVYRDENDIKEKEIKEDERKKKKEAKKQKNENKKVEYKQEPDRNYTGVELNKEYEKIAISKIEKKKPAKPNKKIKLTDFVRDYIKDNQGCEYKIIEDAVNKEGLVPPPYGLKYYLKLISERGFKKGMKLSIKENKYYIEFEK